MKKQILFLTLLLISATSFCQVKFEKGYFINNENQRIECLIKNYDWHNTPNEIEYKLNENIASVISPLAEVKEFGISGVSKFVRANVDIDRSSNDLTALSTQRNPEWSKEQLFLKVLVGGKATLYHYCENNFQRFFYSISDTSIQQLIFKEYIAGTGDLDHSIASNNDFRQQLWNDLKSENLKIDFFENIHCNQKELEKFFRQYNGTSGSPGEDSLNERKSRDLVFIRIKPGINYSSLAVTHKFYGDPMVNTDQNLNFRIGMEAEYILPFNKNKWGFIVAPSYQYFNSNTVNRSNKVNVDYKSIEFPLELRYYMFLNNDLKLFVNGFFTPLFEINFNSKIDISFAITEHQLDITNNYTFLFGAGMDYKKFSIEFDYYPNSDLLRSYLNAATKYHRLSMTVGYTLFKIRH